MVLERKEAGHIQGGSFIYIKLKNANFLNYASIFLRIWDVVYQYKSNFSKFQSIRTLRWTFSKTLLEERYSSSFAVYLSDQIFDN